jgi:hypothetical protein
MWKLLTTSSSPKWSCTWTGCSPPQINKRPFVLPWLTGINGNGVRVLTAKAFDGKNNSQTSTAVHVIVQNETVPPLLSIVTPTEGAALSGTIAASFAATDNDAILSVHVLIDETLLAVLTQPPFTLQWDTTALGNGAHKLTAFGFDRAGNKSVTSVASVTVSNAAVADFDSRFKAPRCATPVASCETNTLVRGRALLGPEPNQPNTLGSSCADGREGVLHDDESVESIRVTSPVGTAFTTGHTVNVEVTGFVYDPAVNEADVYYAQDATAPQWLLVGTVSPAAPGVQTMRLPLTLKGEGTQAVRAQLRYKGAATACAAGDYNDRDDLVFEVQRPGVTLQQPQLPKAALLVVDSLPLRAHEQVMRDQLQDQLGLTVAIKVAAEVELSHAEDKHLIVISDTVSNLPLARKLRFLAVPLITWQPTLLNELGMVVGGGNRFQTFGDGELSLDIVDPHSPLAAGLNDSSPLLVSPAAFFSVVPKGDVTVVARPKGGSDRATVFLFETSAVMAKGPAPARRIAFFGGSAMPHLMTDAAWDIFRATATWALRAAAGRPLRRSIV